MTRKRYIKLTMADGIPRNKAQAMASNIQAAGVPYAQMYGHQKLRRSITFGLINGLSKPLQVVADAAKHLAATARAALECVPLCNELKAIFADIQEEKRR